MRQNGHLMLWFPEERVGSWMKFIFPMPNSDPVQNCSLNFRRQEENLAWHSRRRASKRLVRPMFQVRLASRKLVRTPSAFLPAKRPFPHKEPFLRPKGSEQLFLPILRMELCKHRSPKMVTRMVRHNDQDERQSDAALHWDTIRPVLLKSCAKHGARGFSDQQWLRLIHQGSSKTRFDCCENSKKTLANFRAFQGHPGGKNIWPWVWWWSFWFLTIGKSIFFSGCSFCIQSIRENGLIPGGKESKGRRQTVFLTPLNLFEKIPMKKNPMLITQFFKQCALTVIGNVIKMPFIGQKYAEHKIKDCNSGTRSHMQTSCTVLCQQIASLE